MWTTFFLPPSFYSDETFDHLHSSIVHLTYVKEDYEEFLTQQTLFTAGRQTTNEELEEMLEQGNPAVFTQGVCL